MKENLHSEMVELLKEKGLSRRDALKIAGVASAALIANPTLAEAATVAKAASAAKGKIVIIGAGAAGISVAAKLTNELKEPDITIIDATEKHLYQPAFTLIAGDVVANDYPVAKNADYMPKGVKWIKETATAIDPDAKKVTTDKGNAIAYDYLIVAVGIELQYEAIEGLSRDKIGKNGVASIYFHDGAIAAKAQLKELAKESKNRKVTALFHESPTPIKCGGAPKKIMFLTEDYIRNKDGKRDNLDARLVTPGGGFFGVKIYNDAIKAVIERKGIKAELKHRLVKVDTDAKVATFVKKEEVMDADLGINVTKDVKVEKSFDFLHITPHQTGASIISKNPKFANPTGFMKVNPDTLQSSDYPNIFGIGDIVGTPFGKTGGSVRKQYGVVAQNLIDVMEGKAPSAKYNGYTVCPLITGYGSIMMLEFGYKIDGKDTVLPSAPLDPTQERWLWWLLKVYGLKPMYFSGMLRGKA